MSSVLVYRGEGAGWRSVQSTTESLKRLFSTTLRPYVKVLKVDTISTAQLLEGSWTRHAAMLVMPGGADLPYCRHLNGNGNTIIQEYVSKGGAYLGLCAGAYYGCARVVFEPGTALEVVGDRELAFFPGIAQGAAFPGFDYQTEAGAVAAEVAFKVPTGLQALLPRHHHQQQQQQHQQQQQQQQYYETARLSNVDPLSEPTLNSWAGQTVLTGHDYCNGGPFFTMFDGSSDVEQLPGVSTLARYCQQPDIVSHKALQQHGSKCSADQDTEQQQQQHAGSPPAAASTVQQVAQSAGSRVAAVRCRVGQGVAILCGTHPELGHEWLDPGGHSSADQGPQTPHGLKPGAEHMHCDAASTPQAQQQQQQQQSGCDNVQPVKAAPAAAGVQQPNEIGMATCGSGGSGAGGGGHGTDALTPDACADRALAAHAQRLGTTLQASHSQRDLLMCCLLYEALVSKSQA